MRWRVGDWEVFDPMFTTAMLMMWERLVKMVPYHGRNDLYIWRPHGGPDQHKER